MNVLSKVYLGLWLISVSSLKRDTSKTNGSPTKNGKMLSPTVLAPIFVGARWNQAGLPILVTQLSEREESLRTPGAALGEIIFLVAVLAGVVETCPRSPAATAAAVAAPAEAEDLDHQADPTFGRRMLRKTQWIKVGSGMKRDRFAKVITVEPVSVRVVTITVLWTTPVTIDPTALTPNTKIMLPLLNTFMMFGRAGKLR